MTDNVNFTKWLQPENFLLLMFLFVLAWAPFPLGSNRVWAELILAEGLGGVLFLWSGAALMGFASVTSLVRRLWVPALCVLTALGWALFQSVDLLWLEKATGLPFSFFAHRVWELTSQALGAKVGAYVSVDPEKTRQAVVATSLSIAAFFLAFNLARDRARAAVLLNGLIIIALFYAVMAVVMLQLEIDLQSWLIPEAIPTLDRLTGPFVNPNHFAEYLALGSLAALGTFVESVRQTVVWDRGGQMLFRSALFSLSGPNALRLAAIVGLLSVLLLTQSRAAVFALMTGILALAIMLSRGRDLSPGEAAGRRAIVAILVAVLGLSVALSITPLLDRVQAHGLSDTTRSSLFGSSVDAILTAPMTGQGFGAFERYYPFFADGSVKGQVDEAHNDIIETIADLGVPAGVLFMAGPAFLTWFCFAGVARRRRDRVYPAVAFAASIAVGLHAMADFGLQIPAVAITYAAFLGTGVAQSWRTNMDLVR